MTAWLAWFVISAVLFALWMVGAAALDELRRRWSR